MSLWSIPDYTTSEVIAGFFSNLREGQQKHVALKDAQLAFLKNNKVPKFNHPFYWAGLIQAGSVAPINFSSFWTTWKVVLGLVFLLGIGYLFLKLKGAPGME